MKRGDIDSAEPLTRAEVEFIARCVRQNLDMEWPWVQRLAAHALRTIPAADSTAPVESLETALREALDVD